MKKFRFDKKSFQVLFLVLLVILGFVHFQYTWMKNKNDEADSFLYLAGTVAVALPNEEIKTLAAKPQEKDSPAYQDIKSRLEAIVKANPNADFAYLITRQNGTFQLIVDSDPKDSIHQAFLEADIFYNQPFDDGKSLITNLKATRGGTWRITLIPLFDENSGKTIAVFGINFRSAKWNNLLLYELGESAVLSLILPLMLLFLFIIREKNVSLGNSETNYRRMFESAKEGILILDAQTGMIIEVNPFLMDMLGYSREQFLEKKIWEVGLFRDIAANKEKFSELQRKEYIRYEDLPLETSDGRIINVEFISNIYSVGQMKVIRCSIRDITQRKSAEAALKLSEEHYHTLFNSMLEGYCIVEMIFDSVNNPVDYRFVEVNPAFEGQTGLHDAMGKLMHDLAPEHEAHWFEIYGEVALTGKPVRFQNQAKALNRWFDVHAFRVGAPEDRQVAIYFWDITEIKIAVEDLNNLNVELIRSNNDLAQFAYLTSHDLQEPLRTISTFTQSLAQRYTNKFDEEGRLFIHYIVESTLRMNGLIRDLLTYSRINTQTNKFSEIDFNHLLSKVVNVLLFTIQEKNAEVTSDKLPLVFGDEEQLYQLLLNLVDNAIKFCNTAPKVHISAKEEPLWYHFSVKDNGIGIEPHYKDRIYLIFQRLVNRHEYTGTGIGLAVSKRIVERHGGQIWFESQLAQGTTFYFTIAKNLTR